MKKHFKRAIVYLLFLLIFGCSRDEIDSPINGKWEAISFTTSVPVDANMDGVKNTDLKKEMGCVSMEADFFSNGKFTLETTSVTYDISVVNGEVALKPSGCSSQKENGTWSTDDLYTQLFLEFIIAGKDETTPLTVEIELSENRLVMKDLFYKEIDGEIVTYTIVFERG